jgi:hypothetical protein
MAVLAISVLAAFPRVVKPIIVAGLHGCKEIQELGIDWIATISKCKVRCEAEQELTIASRCQLSHRHLSACIGSIGRHETVSTAGKVHAFD